MSEDRDNRGRFGRGNRARTEAAARRRQRVLSAERLAALVDETLRQVDGQGRDLERHIAELVAREIEAAHKGDAAARRFVITYFAPPERAPRASLGRFPKPSASPAAFLDRVAAAVTAGAVSIDDAAKLARLVGPFMGDEQQRAIAAELQALAAKVADLERHKGYGGARPRLVPV